MKTIEALPGDHLSNVCKQALAIAIKEKCEVQFDFNGVLITATPTSSISNLEAFYRAELDRQHREYQASPEGRAAAAKRGAEILTKQAKVDNLLNSLYNSDKNGDDMDYIIRFLSEFTEVADDISINFDHKKLYNWLAENDFQENWGLGQPKEFYKTRHNMGRYIIGQAMNFLNMNMPPHPCCIRFCEEYSKC